MGLLCNKVKALDFFLFFPPFIWVLGWSFFPRVWGEQQYEFSLTTSGLEEKKSCHSLQYPGGSNGPWQLVTAIHGEADSLMACERLSWGYDCIRCFGDFSASFWIYILCNVCLSFFLRLHCFMFRWLSLNGLEWYFWLYRVKGHCIRVDGDMQESVMEWAMVSQVVSFWEVKIVSESVVDHSIVRQLLLPFFVELTICL
jgi:hypothetical protein